MVNGDEWKQIPWHNSVSDIAWSPWITFGWDFRIRNPTTRMLCWKRSYNSMQILQWPVVVIREGPGPAASVGQSQIVTLDIQLLYILLLWQTTKQLQEGVSTAWADGTVTSGREGLSYLHGSVTTPSTGGLWWWQGGDNRRLSSAWMLVRHS